MLHYVVDGYNVIKSSSNPLFEKGVLRQRREKLLDLIAEQKPQGSPNNAVTVVFDGPAKVPFMDSIPDRESYRGISVVFGAGKTADKRICDIAQKREKNSQTVVVTSDRGIRRLLAGKGIKFVAAEDFLRKLFAPVTKSVSAFAGNGNSEAGGMAEEFKKRWLR
ncbi:MAG: NYN domain-containing protein [Endomicrobiales bacterium]|nr:NYN domain-containing protein [Endomicrobiales bacterium]